MSGRISIDNLSDSLKEMIANSGMTEEQIIELLENEEVIDSLKTDSKSIVGAINELFQSANNGKELIANAIGEPLNAEDTFSAMSGDINGLLAKFKTNMMNNGITVESGDKFKALIDKIATLADSEGKGTQFMVGSITIPTLGDGYYTYTKTYTTTLDLGLEFKPSTVYILDYNYLAFYDYYNGGKSSNTINISNTNQSASLGWGDFTSIVIDDNGVVTLTIGCTTSGYGVHANEQTCEFIAIGVGEEDTTLRDSLASILGDKGVDVTEEDDMANLITKVDTAFANLVPKKIYLYNRGTEYTTITLGTGNGVQKKESDHLYIDGAYFNGALTGGSMIISYTYNTGDENKYLYLDLNSYGGTLRIGSIYDGVSYTLGGRGLLRLDLSEAPSFTSFSISSTDDVHIYEMYTSNM